MQRQAKQPVFVACEGKSEHGYIRWLNRLAEDDGLFIALDPRDMKGGSAATILENAVRFLKRSAGRSRIYHKRYLFLDRDLSANTERDLNLVERKAERNGFGIIWQQICHECFLLKHFSETQNRNPSTANDCMDALNGIWPQYRKGLDAARYDSRMGMEDLIRARGNLPDLDAFLNDIGWN